MSPLSWPGAAGRIIKMSRIPFTVSARAARLIGRENVATSQGAITELVKNAYDADATVCAILFVPSDGRVRDQLSEGGFEALSAVYSQADEAYPVKDDVRVLRPDVSEEVRAELAAAFAKIPDLWIIDNGRGMTTDIIAKQWMVIGTDTKEVDGMSEGGRVMTGAKGIGRFALDRLGQECEMFSAQSGVDDLAHWIVDWGDFEGRGKIITDVEAVLEAETGDMAQIYERFDLASKLPAALPRRLGDEPEEAIAFDHGTAIRISNLHDRWDERDSSKLKDTLEALLPPRDQGDFNIFIHDFRSASDGSFLDNFSPDLFDYRLHAEVRADGSVSIHLDRQEINAAKIRPTVFSLPAMDVDGFRKEDFARGRHAYETNLRKVLRLAENADLSQYLAIGPLNFTLYFFKLSNPTRATLERFPQKSFDAAKRRRWLAASGGVRLYRDDFRVRPYGEPNTQGSDWLLLGQRVASNPAPASRMGWRVPPQQLAGTIHITKEGNPTLADQSNREGIMNERAFALFRQVILGLIGEFERDRAYIYGQFDAAYDLDTKEVADVDDGVKVATKILERQPPSDGQPGLLPPEDNGAARPTVAEGVTMAKAIGALSQRAATLEENAQVLMGMATLGTVLVSFTHELKQIKANMHSRKQRMENALRRVVDEERLAAVPTPVNPYDILARWGREDEKVSRWVDFALSAVSPSKRRRRTILLSEYLADLADYWKEFLASKTAEIHIDVADRGVSVLAHEIDLDSIFYNLIVNSVEAFTRPSDHTSRDIWLSVSAGADDMIVIRYRDTGPGLSTNLKPGDDIFSFGVSSKPNDESGQPTGTGIGMWLLQTIVHDYGGAVILASNIGEPGFDLSFTMPAQRVGGSS